MPNVLIIGATRGLGHELALQYASNPSNTVYGTSRSSTPPTTSPDSKITWLPSIDLTQETASQTLVKHLTQTHSSPKIHTLILSAGYFGAEPSFSPSWASELTMYQTSAMAPVFLITALHKASLLVPHATKIVVVSSEAGSITLRHEKEGGGMYAHHASKAASNMVVKLLSLDLKEEGIAVGAVHPGFMRTEMTRGVGFDKYWDEGGAVTPDVAAGSLISWVEGEFGIGKTGTFWAPRGPRDIGTAGVVLGEGLGTPLELPW